MRLEFAWASVGSSAGSGLLCPARARNPSFLPAVRVLKVGGPHGEPALNPGVLSAFSSRGRRGTGRAPGATAAQLSPA